jgi:uncharacterized membrane protein YqjE
MQKDSTVRTALGGLMAARFSLFGLELRDELDRVAMMVAMAVAAALLLVMALGFLGLSVLLGFWDYRVEICSVMALVFIALGALAWWKMHALMTCAMSPFPLTSEEFAQDKKLIEAAFASPAKESA